MRGHERWLAALACAVRQTARCELIYGPTVDHDDHEQWSGYPGHPCGDLPVMSTVTRRLISVRATVLVVFALPIRQLPEGYYLCFVQDGIEGLWLLGPGLDQDGAEDLTRVILDEAGAMGLREVLLQALAGEGFSHEDDWRRNLLPRIRLWCSVWHTEAGANGLRCSLMIDVSAEL